MTAVPRHMRSVPVAEDAPSGTFSHPSGQGMVGAPSAPWEGTTVPVTLRRRPAVPAAAERPLAAVAAEEGAVLRRRAIPSRPYDDAVYVRERRPSSSQASLTAAVAAALRSVAVVTRVAATALCVLVLANALARGFMWASIVSATAYVTQAILPAVAGRFVAPTILGGTFRGDIAVLAVVLFVVDWVCARLACGLRGR